MKFMRYSNITIKSTEHQLEQNSSWPISAALPHEVKTQYVHFRSQAGYFLLSWKIPEEISRRSMLIHN